MLSEFAMFTLTVLISQKFCKQWQIKGGICYMNLCHNAYRNQSLLQ
jgi:hypothetical protein